MPSEQEIRILSESYRKKRIDEILGSENRARKDEHLKYFEVYKDRQRQFIISRLEEEFSAGTVRDMRKITSINLTKRIVDELASVYLHEATRTWENATEKEEQQLINLYKEAKANIKLKKSNKWFELHEQCAIQVLPIGDKIDIKVFQPHEYDVLPSLDDVEKADVYILSVHDKESLLRSKSTKKLGDASNVISPYRDNTNQGIGDPDDFKREEMRFIWWSDNYHFETDGHGKLILKPGSDDITNIINPIGTIPFVDVVEDKDNEYWVRSGSGIVDFALDYGAILSDVANIIRLQGYAQAVIISEDIPADMTVGPNRILHIPQQANSEKDPSFAFESPNPDLGSSLEFLNVILNNFLTSRGMDATVLSSKAEVTSYSSGVERLLSMIEKFEASRDTLSLFESVEQKIFELMVMWSNYWQDVKDKPLKDELMVSSISENVKLSVKFQKPEVIQTKMEKEDSIIKLLEAGLMSKKEALMQLREIGSQEADKILKEIESQIFIPIMESDNVDKETEESNPDED